MSPPHPGLPESENLRRRAEMLAREKSDSATNGSESEMLRLIHELHVHQIELELQNEELRESRARTESVLNRLTELYDFAPVSYFTLDPSGKIKEVNLPGTRLLGLERSLLVGRFFQNFLHVESILAFQNWIRTVTTTDRPVSIQLMLNPIGEKSTMTVELDGSQSGAELRVVAVDVSERKMLEVRLQQAQKMEIVGQLAGGVAHDFNNIMAAIILTVNWIKEGETDLQSLEDLEALALRASSLTHELLAFSRKQAMKVQHLDFHQHIAALLKMLVRLLGRSVKCEWKPNSSPIWIEADPVMLDQAIMNLCINARDAMPQGGSLTLKSSIIEIHSNSKSEPNSKIGSFACLEVADSGCGISREALSHIFEPYFTTKDVGKGTGLGLATVYGIVQQHLGWLEVESEVNSGTTFKLYFPLVRPHDTAVSKPPTKSTPSRTTQQILLVEDESELRRLIEASLKSTGYSVITAKDGVDALQVWEQHHEEISLLLTDMVMPNGISGAKLAQKLLKAKPSLKVIVMSGYSTEYLEVDDFPHTFLAKPFDLKALKDTVRDFMTPFISSN